MLEDLGIRAQDAAVILAGIPEKTRNDALEAIASALEENTAAILAANEKDMDLGREAGLRQALLDRLLLTPERIRGCADGVRAAAALPDPLGRLLEETRRPNGLLIRKISVPMGVIAVIYEARPNVTVDSAALCLKSGNAVLLRGGKEAKFSNMALAEIMRAALARAGLPADCIQLVDCESRESARALMELKGYVDLLIPRGGAGLIRAVVENAKVPVIETGAGTCHVYVDRAADPDMAADILYNAKTSRPSVCNAAECVLIHRDIAPVFIPKMAASLARKSVEIRGDEAVCALLPSAVPAAEDDWGREYGDYILAARVVDSLEEAMAHIRRYGTRHSECIVTADETAADRFLRGVDAAAVYHNASTRFTDGGEFGLGAEIGISTQKLHARGPLGLRELTTMKYMIFGDGQVRV
ncbi:MAG: glutamate-5-semialdehyde dehydrogenase [Oscillospiraceae bacterium]|nr:glutamate-5-semialdehyde dehydrogenase [Oscillospiraceae bacterium]